MSHNSDFSLNPCDIRSPLPQKEGGFRCEICGVLFKSTWHYREHIMDTFQLEQEALDFLSYSLDLPAIQVKPPVTKIDEDLEDIICPDCHKHFKGRKGLNQHIGKVHSKKRRRSQCKECGKKFSNRYGLSFHVKQVHKKTTRVECSFCKKMMYNKYVLEKHVKSEHSENYSS